MAVNGKSAQADGLRRDGNEANLTGQSGLADVKGAKFRRANQLGGSHVQDVQGAATDSRRLDQGIGLGLRQNMMPQTASRNQQTSGAIVFHLLSGGLNLLLGEPLLKQGQTERVAQFKAVKSGEGQRRWVGLPTDVSPLRICVGGVERK